MNPLFWIIAIIIAIVLWIALANLFDGIGLITLKVYQYLIKNIMGDREEK